LNRFDTEHECDRQTNRRTDRRTDRQTSRRWQRRAAFARKNIGAGRFLRATAECFARLSHLLGVLPSVCHIRDLYQNGTSWNHEIFTVSCPKDSSLW